MSFCLKLTVYLLRHSNLTIRVFTSNQRRNKNSKPQSGKSLLFITQNLPSLTLTTRVLFYFFSLQICIYLYSYYWTVSYPDLFHNLPQTLLLWSRCASRLAILNLIWILIWIYCIGNHKQWGSQRKERCKTCNTHLLVHNLWERLQPNVQLVLKILSYI